MGVLISFTLAMPLVVVSTLVSHIFASFSPTETKIVHGD